MRHLPQGGWGEQGRAMLLAGCVPASAPSPLNCLLLTQLVHAPAYGLELLPQKLCLILEHLYLLIPGWSCIRPNRRRHWGRSPLSPARRYGSGNPVPPSPTTTSARAVTTPSSAAHPPASTAIKPPARTRGSPARCVITRAITHAPARPRSHSSRSGSISCWHSNHLLSFWIGTYSGIIPANAGIHLCFQHRFPPARE